MMSMEDCLISGVLLIFLFAVIFLLNKICRKIRRKIGGRTLNGILYGKYEVTGYQRYDCELDNRRRH